MGTHYRLSVVTTRIRDMKQAPTDPELAAVRDAQGARDAAEVALLQTVITWTCAHRVDNSLVDELTFGVDGILLGGVGCPLVSEFDVYDLAVGLGMSTDAGCTYVGKVLELRYRLPKTWERVLALEVPVWKAFKVCESTMNLSYEAARYIDQMLAPVLHSCTFAQIERTVAQAVDLYDPDEAERRAAKAADDRSFDIHLGTRGPTTDGTIAISGSVSLEDALDLEQAVKDGAKTLGDLGCDESLDVRRSMAVGEMARNQLALNLETEDGDEAAQSTTSGGRTGGGRGVNLYAHLDPDTLHATVDNVGRRRRVDRSDQGLVPDRGEHGHHPARDRPQHPNLHQRLHAHREARRTSPTP